MITPPPRRPARSSSPREPGWARVAVWLAFGAAWLLGLAGCSRSDPYPRATPDDVIRSARLMVENGEPERLHELIHSESPEMREVLRRVGVLLGRLDELGREVQRAFPEDVARMKEEARAAVARGDTPALLSSVASAGGRAPRGAQRRREQAFERLTRSLFADPYGFLRESEGRLSTVAMTEDLAAVQWDSRPILPPVGLVLKKQDGAWGVVLPTQLPVVSRYMPRTREEWSIVAALVKVIDHAVVDLTEDIRTRRVKSLEEAAEEVGRKAFLPAGMVFIAYDRAMKARASGGPEREPVGVGTPR